MVAMVARSMVGHGSRRRAAHVLLKYRSVNRSSAARLRLHTQAQGSPASCTPTTLIAPRLVRVQAAAPDAEAKRPIRLQLTYSLFLAVVTWLSISMLPGGVLAAEPVDAVGHGLARGAARRLL